MRGGYHGPKWTRLAVLQLCLLAVCVVDRVEGASEGTTKLRIAYVTNAWWPKVDGAAISVMEHVRYFASQGHPVLVVRPSYEPGSRLTLSAAGQEEPLPPSQLLAFVNFQTGGTRGGGYEPSMDPFDFPQVERKLTAWAPDVLLVADPDLFLFDAFRIPGFNGMSRSSRPEPVTIACFTSFAVDAALAMPEFWWMHNPPLKKLFKQGLSTAYASFDHIFLNGQPSLEYIRPLHALHPWWEWRPYHQRARVVASRGVPADFCTRPAAERCSSLAAVHSIRAGRHESSDLLLVYVGRLSYDKNVDNLLAAFELSHKHQKAKGGRLPRLFIAGQGELDWLVREYQTRLGNAVTYLGQVMHSDVSCLLREVDSYISAAQNETYGRALVEAKRCALPILTVESCNMHVRHGHDGLLAADVVGLSEQITAIVEDPQLHARLAANAVAPPTEADAALAANQQMLQEVLDAYERTYGPTRAGGQRLPRPRPWHPFWGAWLSVSRVLDEPVAATTAALIGTTTSVMVLTRGGRETRALLEGGSAPLWLILLAMLLLASMLFAAQSALYVADGMLSALAVVLTATQPLTPLWLEAAGIAILAGGILLISALCLFRLLRRAIQG